MAIERLILPEPLTVGSSKKHSSRTLGGIIMAMRQDSVWSLEKGRHDVTPDHQLATPFTQILTVLASGIATLRIAHGQISDEELSCLTSGGQTDVAMLDKRRDTFLEIKDDRPVMLQTLDGSSNPYASPIVGVIRYRPE